MRLEWGLRLRLCVLVFSHLPCVMSSLISILLTLVAFVSTLTATLDEKCFGRLLGQNKGRRRGSSQLGGEKSRIETDCLFSCLAPFGRPAPCIFAYASSPQFSMHCRSITIPHICLFLHQQLRIWHLRRHYIRFLTPLLLIIAMYATQCLGSPLKQSSLTSCDLYSLIALLKTQTAQ